MQRPDVRKNRACSALQCGCKMKPRLVWGLRVLTGEAAELRSSEVRAKKGGFAQWTQETH